MPSSRRQFRRFTHLGAKFRVACSRYGLFTAEVVRQRDLLERYLRRHPAFGESLAPVPVLPGAPEVARRMAAAADTVGVGPMAAVAGAMAQRAAEAALAGGDCEVVVDNGGDLFMVLRQPLRVQLDTGDTSLGARLAFLVQPDETPLSICSSSGTMGHSLSLGRCDLATVVAADAALADAAATLAGNLVREEKDIQAALDRLIAIPGIHGAVLVKEGRVGLVGTLPRLVRGEPSADTRRAPGGAAPTARAAGTRRRSAGRGGSRRL
jgi:ApbE superfamily uncharacterized protein (UPF0280 family)